MREGPRRAQPASGCFCCVCRGLRARPFRAESAGRADMRFPHPPPVDFQRVSRLDNRAKHIDNRGERLPLTHTLLKPRVRVGGFDGGSDSAAAFLQLFCIEVLFHCLCPPTIERRALLHYAQYFRSGWNPCVPVPTLGSCICLCTARVAKQQDLRKPASLSAPWPGQMTRTFLSSEHKCSVEN